MDREPSKGSWREGRPSLWQLADGSIGPPSDATTLRAFQDSAGPLGRHFLLYNLQANFLLDDTDDYFAR